MVTKHAKRRLKQRTGISNSQVDKVVSRALNDGIKHSDAKGKLREWMDSEYLKYCTANNCRYYAHKLYIFHNNILITVLDADDSIDNNLRENVETYRTYIRYRKRRYARRKNPKESMIKLAVELNEFVPELITEEFVKLNIPAQIEEVRVKDSLTIEIKYKPYGLVDKDSLSQLKTVAKNMFDLELTTQIIYSLDLPKARSNCSSLQKYFMKECFLNPDLINCLIQRKVIYESTKGYCVFVGCDIYRIPQSASIYSWGDNDMLYLMDASGSSDIYTFSLIDNSNVINLFENEIEALSYLSLLRIKQLNDEGIAVYNYNIYALGRILRDNPNINTIRVCGHHKKILTFDYVKEIRDAFGDNYTIVTDKPYFRKYNDDLRYCVTGML